MERPVSVVKELLKNSLGAGASHIRVEAEAGGRRLIRITDDGHGMLRAITRSVQLCSSLNWISVRSSQLKCLLFVSMATHYLRITAALRIRGCLRLMPRFVE